MNKFYIDINYVTSIVDRQVYYTRQKEDEADEDFLIRKLQNPGPTIISTGTLDHPEFTKLRDKLEKLGFISTQRNSWNGDRVLKMFYLNDVKFSKGYKFPCAAAMKWTLENGKATL